MEKTGLKLGSNGQDGDVEEETQEQLNTAYKNLLELGDGKTSMVTMSKQDLSLMKQILTAASEEYKEQIMWRMCDFIDEDEALDHVAAYYEAKELGLDTGFNVAFMFALVSTNRKTSKSNLIALILDTVQHGKWAPRITKGRANGNITARSPLDN